MLTSSKDKMIVSKTIDYGSSPYVSAICYISICSSALVCKTKEKSAILLYNSILRISSVWLERVIWDHEVAGSSPVFSTI